MAVADRARDFWGRISPRERVMVVVLGIAVPITLAIWFAMSIGDRLDAMEVSNDRLRKAIDVVATMRANGSGSMQQAPVDDVVSTMGTVPYDKFDTDLRAVAAKAGITVKSVRQRPEARRNKFVTTSVSVSLDPLSLEELKSFLQGIETSSKVIAVTELELRTSRSNRDKIDITDLVVSAYSREPTEAEAAAGGGSAGSGSSGSSVDGSGKAN